LLSRLRDEQPIAYPDFPYSRYHKTDDVSWMSDMVCLEDSSTKQLSLNLV
jgi:DNA (cytosine-5)-methyltransferase 1